MRKYNLLHLMIAFLLCVSGCEQPSNSTNKISKSAVDTNSPRKSINTISTHIVNDVEQITFGSYFGECTHNCATMYKYHIGGNSSTLWVDYTDSYFKRGVDKMVFETQITDLSKHDLANDIVNHIPRMLLSSTKPSQTFGCPDCKDGGGIYLEIMQNRKQNRKISKFYIDYSTSELNAHIRDFAEYLKITLRKFSDVKN